VRKNRKDKKGIFAVTTNISKTGLALVMHDELENVFNIGQSDMENASVFIDVFFSDENMITFEGIIARQCKKDKGIEYGLKIIDMDIDSEKSLSELIINLANEDKEFYNKRSGFWSKNSKLGKMD
jgi:c-di-GMP-binding flagellar brake protein YcgR